MAVDNAKYEIIFSQGGIIFDINFKLERAPDHEMCSYDYFNFFNVARNIENSFIASKKNHPILEQTLDDLHFLFLHRDSILYSNLNTSYAGDTDTLFRLFEMNNHLNATKNTLISNYDNRSSLTPWDQCQTELKPAGILKEEFKYISYPYHDNAQPMGEDTRDGSGFTWK